MVPWNRFLGSLKVKILAQLSRSSDCIAILAAASLLHLGSIPITIRTLDAYSTSAVSWESGRKERGRESRVSERHVDSDILRGDGVLESNMTTAKKVRLS